jgi:hypothetical protein
LTLGRYSEQYVVSICVYSAVGGYSQQFIVSIYTLLHVNIPVFYYTNKSEELGWVYDSALLALHPSLTVHMIGT